MAVTSSMVAIIPSLDEEADHGRSIGTDWNPAELEIALVMLMPFMAAPSRAMGTTRRTQKSSGTIVSLFREIMKSASRLIAARIPSLTLAVYPTFLSCSIICRLIPIELDFSESAVNLVETAASVDASFMTTINTFFLEE